MQRRADCLLFIYLLIWPHCLTKASFHSFHLLKISSLRRVIQYLSKSLHKSNKLAKTCASLDPFSRKTNVENAWRVNQSATLLHQSNFNHVSISRCRSSPSPGTQGSGSKGPGKGNNRWTGSLNQTSSRPTNNIGTRLNLKLHFFNTITHP